jgi:hypothetical protein
VALYANWAGAYTVINSTLITISSAEPAQRPEPLESLIHEASHALVGNFQSKLDSDLRGAGKTPEFGLVHVIIFYTLGFATLEALGKNGNGYVRYAIKNGLYGRAANWKHYRDLCDNHRRPYLGGRTTFDAAAAQIAKDLSDRPASRFNLHLAETKPKPIRVVRA